MSDEEEYSEEEIEEEIEDSEAAAPPPTEEPEQSESEQPEPEQEVPEPTPPSTVQAPESEQPKLRRVERPAHKEGEQDGQQLTEAEQAMLAAKKRHEEEREQRAINADNQRKLELKTSTQESQIKTVEGELVLLKQRQAERKKEREIEEREFAERRRQDDERRRQEIEERKAKTEEQKRIKEEEKLKRQQMMAGSFVTTTVGNKRKERTAEQQAEAKRNYMASIQKADIGNLLPNDLKVKIKQLYQKILRLESDKYDLQQRHGRQDYDLKELTERESQRARNKAIALGVEVEKAQSGQVRPPKINVASKHDRQKDHRSYGERRDKFENPYEKPAPSIAHGSGRPPPEWGKRHNDEIENIRKNMELTKYVELAPVEGDLAKPPVSVVPMQVPSE